LSGILRRYRIVVGLTRNGTDYVEVPITSPIRHDVVSQLREAPAPHKKVNASAKYAFCGINNGPSRPIST